MGASFHDVVRNPSKYIPKITESLDKEANSVFLFPVGHLEYDDAEIMADTLELACEEAGGLLEVFRLLLEEEPVILIQYKKGMQYKS